MLYMRYFTFCRKMNLQFQLKSKAINETGGRMHLLFRNDGVCVQNKTLLWDVDSMQSLFYTPRI